jgi:ligand-binding sensor domain-containing protein/signal transduction histidine kinase
MIQAHRMRGWLLTGLAGLCFANAARALDSPKPLSQYVHDQWGTDRGFLGGAVYAICQSSDGYLWIGTERGLVRFDGFKFTLIQKPLPEAPPIGPVRGLVSDADGNLWIRTESPSLLLYRDGRFVDASALFHLPQITFTANSIDNGGELVFSGIANQTIRIRNGAIEMTANTPQVPGIIISLGETRDGRLWIGTRDNGLFRIDGEHVSNVSLAKNLANSKINSLLPVSSGLWIGTDNGISFLDSSDRIKIDLPASVSRLQILALARGPAASVWAGTDHGLIRISPSGTASLDLLKNGPGQEVTAVYGDRDGELWFGGAHGLERLRSGVFSAYSTADGLPSDKNGPVFTDAEGRTWFAPLSGGLYWLKDNRVGRITLAGLEDDVVYSISGGSGEVWVGRQRGGLTMLKQSGESFTARTYTQADGLAQNSVYSVHRNRDGTVWAGTVTGGCSRLRNGVFTNFPASNGLSSNGVNSIVEGNDGKMWFATPTGLAAFAAERWEYYTLQDGLPSVNVRSIFEDSGQVLWIATSAGLAFFSSGHIHLPRNLPEVLREQIFGIAEDGLGSLWFATSDHVVRINRDRLLTGAISESDMQIYGTEDGLLGVAGVDRDRSMVGDTDGRVWVSLDRGLAVADPKIALNYSTPIKVRVESLLADGNPVDLQGTPRIAAGSHSITVNYAGISPSAADRVRYRYKLDEADREWSDILAARQVIYKNLGPGSYTFRVVASNGEGFWNSPETAIPFVIEPAIWQTWWFRSLCLSAGIVSIIAIYRLRMYQLARNLNVRFQERLSERTRIAQELHDTLLQSFHGLMLRFQTADEMLPARPADAKQVLEDALGRADLALSESRDAIQNLRSAAPSSLDLAQTMNDLMTDMKGEFSQGNGEAPAVSVVTSGAPHGVNPIVRDEICRIARESLRNAFHHARAHSIETEIEYGEALLRLRFRDDGTGIDPRVIERGGRQGHWGIVGMKERAKQMGAQLDVWSRPGAGTEVELRLPAKIAYETSNGRVRFRLFRRKAGMNHEHKS